MTNPHTPIKPRPRDERDEPAWDAMGRCGDWFWGTLLTIGLAVFGAWKGGFL